MFTPSLQGKQDIRNKLRSLLAQRDGFPQERQRKRSRDTYLNPQTLEGNFKGAFNDKVVTSNRTSTEVVSDIIHLQHKPSVTLYC